MKFALYFTPRCQGSWEHCVFMALRKEKKREKHQAELENGSPAIPGFVLKARGRGRESDCRIEALLRLD